ncbi:hypothetical protein HDU92_005534 [Lobulomyces angularis]|nr:hypothetical protein HDU92_005534 [Lobulomyces angularis]
MLSDNTSEKIKVAIRVRPLTDREKSENEKKLWLISGTYLKLPTQPPFHFDNVYQTSTDCLYNDLLKKDLILKCLEGINGTIFAYGQTSSGKTYTMQGTHKDKGIISLSIQDIFNFIIQNPQREFLLRVSYLEIYNESVRDLLQPDSKDLKIHENRNREFFVDNLSEVVVVSASETEELLRKGNANRQMGETKMNENSSRSHTIFKIVIESRELDENTRKSVNGAVKVSQLNLVDLAGSERVGSTGAEGLRLREGSHINKSLLILGTVIGKLSEGGDKKHIPYRDSKLTLILKQSLGGNANTAIICNITPAASFVEETLSTLKFASRAKTIRNKPEINEVLSDEALLRKYKNEIQELKNQLKKVKSSSLSDDSNHDKKLEEHEKLVLLDHIEKLKRVILTASNTSNNSDTQKRIVRRKTWFAGAGENIEYLEDKEKPEIRNIFTSPIKRNTRKADCNREAVLDKTTPKNKKEVSSQTKQFWYSALTYLLKVIEDHEFSEIEQQCHWSEEKTSEISTLKSFCMNDIWSSGKLLKDLKSVFVDPGILVDDVKTLELANLEKELANKIYCKQLEKIEKINILETEFNYLLKENTLLKEAAKENLKNDTKNAETSTFFDVPNNVANNALSFPMNNLENERLSNTEFAEESAMSDKEVLKIKNTNENNFDENFIKLEKKYSLELRELEAINTALAQQSYIREYENSLLLKEAFDYQSLVSALQMELKCSEMKINNGRRNQLEDIEHLNFTASNPVNEKNVLDKTEKATSIETVENCKELAILRLENTELKTSINSLVLQLETLKNLGNTEFDSLKKTGKQSPSALNEEISEPIPELIPELQNLLIDFSADFNKLKKSKFRDNENASGPICEFRSVSFVDGNESDEISIVKSLLLELKNIRLCTQDQIKLLLKENTDNFTSIQLLKDELTALQEFIQTQEIDAASEISRNKAMVIDLQSIVGSLNKDFAAEKENLSNEVYKYRNLTEKLDSQLIDVKQEYQLEKSKLLESVSLLQSSISQLNSDVESLTQLNDTLKMEISKEEFNEASVIIELQKKLEDANEANRLIISEAKDKSEKLRCEQLNSMEAFESEISELKVAILNKHTENDILKTEINSKNNAIEVLSAELKKEAEKFKIFENQFFEIQDDLDLCKNKLQCEKMVSNNLKEELEKFKLILENTVDEVRILNEGQLISKRECESAMNLLLEQKKSWQTLYDYSIEIESKVLSFNKLNVSYNQEIQNLHGALERLGSEYENENLNLSEQVNTLKTLLSESEASINYSDEVHGTLKEHISNLEKKKNALISELKEEKEAVSKILTEKFNLESELNQNQLSLNAEIEKNVVHTDTIMAMKVEHRNLYSRIEEIEKKNFELNQTNTKLLSVAENCDVNYRNKELEVDSIKCEFETQNEILSGELEKIKSSLEKVLQQLYQLRLKTAEFFHTSENLKKKLGEAEGKINSLRSLKTNNKELAGIIKEKDAQIKKKDILIEKLELSKEYCIQDLMKKIEDGRAEYTNILVKYKEIEAELNKIKAFEKKDLSPKNSDIQDKNVQSPKLIKNKKSDSDCLSDSNLNFETIESKLNTELNLLISTLDIKILDHLSVLKENLRINFFGNIEDLKLKFSHIDGQNGGDVLCNKIKKLVELMSICTDNIINDIKNDTDDTTVEEKNGYTNQLVAEVNLLKNEKRQWQMMKIHGENELKKRNSKIEEQKNELETIKKVYSEQNNSVTDKKILKRKVLGKENFDQITKLHRKRSTNEVNDEQCAQQ